jgi:hypothetical protein
LLGLVIAGSAFFLFRRESNPETGPMAATPARNAEAAPAKAADASSATPTATPSPVALPRPTEPLPVVTAEPAISAPPSTSIATNPPSIAAKTPEPPAAATSSSSEPPAPSLRMIEAIEALRVAGIRVGAGSDAKVLMNDRVYRIGDTVDHALGLKLTGATASSLTFRDGTGAAYTRNF